MPLCRLCPRNCGVDRINAKGYCGGGMKASVAHVMLHMWEEPCISGSNGSGAVFFSGCQLKCVYCQNREISHGKIASGTEKTPRELADIFLHLRDEGAHNINLVTPDHYAVQIKEAAGIAKSLGLDIPFVYNCSGYVNPSTLQMIDFVDIYLVDFKYMDDNLAERYSSCHGYADAAKAAVAEMVRQRPVPAFDKAGMMTGGVIVRHLVIPGCADDSKRIIEYLFGTYGDTIYISLMNQFTPVGLEEFPEINRRLTTLEYKRLVEYAKSLGINNAYVQERAAADKNFIPDFGFRISD
ncbi:MAG: radical SAM protein [Eubacteriales bacterium]|nr:radical SAM protein [Eubacteriales bacterium]